MSRFSLMLLTTAGLFTAAAGALPAPLIPSIAAYFGAEPQAAATAVAVYAGPLALMLPVAGTVVDRFGAPRVLPPAMLAHAVFGALCGLSPSLGWLTAMRMAQGLTLAFFMPSVMWSVASGVREEHRGSVMSRFVSVVSISGVISPLMGGWVGSFNWRWAFFLYSLSSIPAVVLFRVLPVKEAGHKKTQDRIALKKVLPIVVFLCACGFLCFTVLYATVLYMPLMAKEFFGAGSAVAGAMLSSQAVFSSLSAWNFDKIAKRVGSRWALMSVGFLLTSVSAVFYAVHPDQLIVWAALCTAGVGFGFLFSSISSLLTILIPKQFVGKAAGVLGSVQGAGIFAAPFIYGLFLRAGSFSLVFLAAVIFGLVGAATAVGFGRAVKN